MIAQRYDLVREIGRGGMGAVWLATDTVLGRDVAVKRVGAMPGAEQADLLRAEREARLAARLNHPHVVAVYDLVAEGDEHWLVMEYVEGVTLAGMVRRDGALSPDEAAPIIRQAADALTAAHESSIVHRDVKPSNILVDPDGNAKLSDFGIARAEADATLTQTGLVTGSPAYLAPEVASGAVATSASDVWALGATLFHALADHPPYDVGDNLMGALYRIVHEDPPRLSNAGWLAPLLEHTMTHDPQARWSMAQVRDFLAAGSDGAILHPEPAQPLEAVASGETRAMNPAPPVAPSSGASAQVAAQVAAQGPARQPAQGTAPPPTPVEIAPEPEHGRRRRGIPVLPVLIAAGIATVLLLGALAWGYLQPGNGLRTPGANVDPSRTSSSSTSQATGPTVDGMQAFIRHYLATAPNDPKQTYAELTPDFQEASGGMAGYRGFWDTIRSAELASISADPKALTVSYTVDYVREDSSTATSDVRLQLEWRDGKYLIAGES